VTLNALTMAVVKPKFYLLAYGHIADTERIVCL